MAGCGGAGEAGSRPTSRAGGHERLRCPQGREGAAAQSADLLAGQAARETGSQRQRVEQQQHARWPHAHQEAAVSQRGEGQQAARASTSCCLRPPVRLRRRPLDDAAGQEARLPLPHSAQASRRIFGLPFFFTVHTRACCAPASYSSFCHDRWRRSSNFSLLLLVLHCAVQVAHRCRPSHPAQARN
jgi:hypothetical protein